MLICQYDQGFIWKLKTHLLPRLQQMILSENDGAASDWQSIVLKNDRIYTHKTLQIKYTTYDVRRSEEVIHVDTQRCNITLLNPLFQEDNSQHPFRYAKVLGIFHVNALYIHQQNRDFYPRRLDVLWVRWYKNFEDPTRRRHTNCRLDEITFLSVVCQDSHGFVDPADIVRATHVIPGFPYGRIHSDGNGLSYLSRDGSDWKRYYVNR